MGRKRHKRTERESVWLARNSGVEHGHTHAVYADRESAMTWLRMKHGECLADAARTYEYTKREYAERAATDPDPAMREYYKTSAENPMVRKVTPIVESRDFASFEDGDYDRYSIVRHDVLTFEVDPADHGSVTDTVSQSDNRRATEKE